MPGKDNFILFHCEGPKYFFSLVKLTFNVVILYLINEAFIYIKGFHDEKTKVTIYNFSLIRVYFQGLMFHTDFI